MESNLFFYKTILNVSDQIVEDPVLLMAMSHLFEWANREGLNGRKVCGLKLVSPSNPWHNPMDCYKKFRCIVYVTREEFEIIKEQHKDAWRAWCRDMGIDENAADEAVDQRARNFLEKIYANPI
jgi:hypothetical protein